jgi:hypothetical protein
MHILEILAKVSLSIILPSGDLRQIVSINFPGWLLLHDDDGNSEEKNRASN